jgi:transcriptional regulator with XRE-family HTH domain
MLTTLDIKAELIRRSYTAARLARELGCHRSTVTRVINGEYPYQRILVELARIIGVPVGDLAPGRATPHESEHIAPSPSRSTQKPGPISTLAAPAGLRRRTRRASGGAC